MLFYLEHAETQVKKRTRVHLKTLRALLAHFQTREFVPLSHSMNTVQSRKIF